jgi:hypothetical protein
MYPTKKEILAIPHKVKQIDIGAINIWKNICYKDKWKSADILGKLVYLKLLCAILNMLHPENLLKNVIVRSWYAYDPKKKIIILDKDNPSILSTLHEYGHHLLGTSELEACVWSVRLFENTFPNEFKKLHWDGHMLKLAK